MPIIKSAGVLHFGSELRMVSKVLHEHAASLSAASHANRSRRLTKCAKDFWTLPRSLSLGWCESLDLKADMGRYVSGLGQPPFDPRMIRMRFLRGEVVSGCPLAYDCSMPLRRLHRAGYDVADNLLTAMTQIGFCPEPGTTILDCGCGEGGLVYRLLDFGFDAYGFAFFLTPNDEP